MPGPRTSIPVLALAAAAALLMAAGSRADWLVTREGERLETRGPWQIKGKAVVFHDTGGQLRSLRLADLDLEASEAASRAAAEAAARAAAEASDLPPAPAPPPGPPVRRITDADIRPSQAPTESGAERLAARLRQALERKDIPSAMELVRWEGAPPRARSLMEKLLEHAITRPVTGVRIVAVGERDETEYEIEGVTYRPNVEVTGKMLVDLGPAEGGAPGDTTQISFLIGRALGAYYIASAAADPGG